MDPEKKEGNRYVNIFFWGKEKPMFSLGNLNGKPIDLLLCTFTPSFTLCSSSKLSLSWVVIGRSNTPY